VESARGTHVAVSRSLPCPARDAREAGLSQSSPAASADAPLSLCSGRTAMIHTLTTVVTQLSIVALHRNAQQKMRSIVKHAAWSVRWSQT